MIEAIRKFFTRPTWGEALSARYDSPAAICRVVKGMVKYSPDRRDSWKTPASTWSDGYGDCEDIAVLIHELCAAHGFISAIKVYFGMTGSKSGHAVVHGLDWWATNGQYRSDVRRMDAVVAAQLGVRPEALHSMSPSDATIERLLS